MFTASNPARLRPNLFTLISLHRARLVWTIGVAAVLGLGAIKAGVFAILIPFIVASVWSPLFRLAKHGNASPGLVIGVNPTRVAVLTDLRKWDGEYLAVKIFNCSFTPVQGRAPEPGMRVATVAEYGGGPQEHWRTFYPVIAQTLTRDQAQIDHLMEQFPEESWTDLERCVDVLPEKLPGIYYLWEEQIKRRNG